MTTTGTARHALAMLVAAAALAVAGCSGGGEDTPDSPITSEEAPAMDIANLPDIDAKVGLEYPGASVNLIPEYVEMLVEIVRHADKMIADTGQQQNQRPPRFFQLGGNETLRILGKASEGVIPATTDHESPMRKRFAPDLQGVSHVTHVHGVVTVQEFP